MKHYFSRRVRVVLILALVLAAVLGVASNITGKNIPGMLVQSVLTPLRTGANALTAQAERIYNYIFKYESLAAENESLKQLIAQLQEDARQADALERENQRYRDLLALKADHEDYELVDGYIISRSSADWVSTFTINRGASAGIQVGMCAITANGEVAGLVTEVGSNYAVIKTVLDASLSISATIASTGYSGMVTGGYTTGLKDQLRMEYLPSSAVIRNNDQVVTSGSTVYPRNLILGYVVDAGFGETGVEKYAILRPAADISALEQVFVLTDYDTEKG